jgi:riboflavin biosynthesis pyrimidine reductase
VTLLTTVRNWSGMTNAALARELIARFDRQDYPSLTHRIADSPQGVKLRKMGLREACLSFDLDKLILMFTHSSGPMSRLEIVIDGRGRVTYSVHTPRDSDEPFWFFESSQNPIAWDSRRADVTELGSKRGDGASVLRKSLEGLAAYL